MTGARLGWEGYRDAGSGRHRQQLGWGHLQRVGCAGTRTKTSSLWNLFRQHCKLHSERAWFAGRRAAFARGVDAVQHRRQPQHARQLQRAWRVVL